MKKLLAIWGIALGGLLSAAPASAAVIITFVPSATHINVGDGVTVQMNISGLGAEILSGIDINMLFNNTVLSNTFVVHDVTLQWPGTAADWFFSASFGAGNTGVFDYSELDDAAIAAFQADAFTVLTFGFIGEADGFSLISLGADPLFARNFVGLDFATLNVEVGEVCISVGTGACDGTPVPEPGTLALLGLGILGLGMSRRRRES